jgi:hypothetical protein
LRKPILDFPVYFDLSDLSLTACHNAVSATEDAVLALALSCVFTRALRLPCMTACATMQFRSSCRHVRPASLIPVAFPSHLHPTASMALHLCDVSDLSLTACHNAVSATEDAVLAFALSCVFTRALRLPCMTACATMQFRSSCRHVRPASLIPVAFPSLLHPTASMAPHLDAQELASADRMLRAGSGKSQILYHGPSLLRNVCVSIRN